MNTPDHLDMRFFYAWVAMCKRLEVDPFDIIRVAYCESHVLPHAHNPRGDASGLIQFMPKTLLGLGWIEGHATFRRLRAFEQIPYVERYFARHAAYVKSDALAYVVTFLPALVKKASECGPDLVLCSRDESRLQHWPQYLRKQLVQAYEWNPVLDRITTGGIIGKDGDITTGDLAMHLRLTCAGPRYSAIVECLRHAIGSDPDTTSTIPAPQDSAPAEPTLTSPRITLPIGASVGDDIADATLREIQGRHDDEDDA